MADSQGIPRGVGLGAEKHFMSYLGIADGCWYNLIVQASRYKYAHIQIRTYKSILSKQASATTELFKTVLSFGVLSFSL